MVQVPPPLGYSAGGEMLWSVQLEHRHRGTFKLFSWEGGKSFIRCYNQQMPFIKWKGKPQTHYLF